MYKRGYTNGDKVIEVIDGNLDVVLYNESGESFYYYRFKPERVIGRKFQGRVNIVSQQEIRDLLTECGKEDYEGFINELVQLAQASGMKERYDM